jgi:hypothetical protein
VNKKLFSLLYSTYLPAIVVLLIIVVVSIVTKIPIGAFTRDMAALAEIKPYMGLLSNLGMLLWASAAAICFFASAFLLKKTALILHIFSYMQAF